MSGTIEVGATRLAGKHDYGLSKLIGVEEDGTVGVLSLIAGMSDAQSSAAQAWFALLAVKAPATVGGEAVCKDVGVTAEVVEVGSHVSINSSVSSSKARGRALAHAVQHQSDDCVDDGSQVTYSADYVCADSDGLCYLDLLAPRSRSHAQRQLGCGPTFRELLAWPVSDFVDGWQSLKMSRVRMSRYHVGSSGPVDAYSCFASLAGFSDWPVGSLGEYCAPGFPGVSRLLVEKRPLFTDTIGFDRMCRCSACVGKTELSIRGRTVAGSGSYECGPAMRSELKEARKWFSPAHTECGVVEIVESSVGARLLERPVDEFSSEDSICKVELRGSVAAGVHCFRSPAWVVGVPPRTCKFGVNDVEVMPASEPLLVAGRGPCRVSGPGGSYVYVRLMPDLRRFVHQVMGCAVGSAEGAFRYKLSPKFAYKPPLSLIPRGLMCVDLAEDELGVGDTFKLLGGKCSQVEIGIHGSCVVSDRVVRYQFPGFQMSCEAVYVCGNATSSFDVTPLAAGSRASVGDDACLIEDGGPSDDDDPKYCDCV